MGDGQETSNSTTGKNYRLIAEIDPPKGVDLEPFIDTALQLRGRVDTTRVTDSEHAIMRMSPLAPCVSLMDRGFEPEMTITGRDRNRISFQADLLSAAALGINRIVIKKGHDPAEGDQPVARSSGDLDLVTMLKCAAALNSGKDLGGESLTGTPTFDIDVAIDLSDDVNLNRERAEFFRQMAGYGVKSVTLGPTYDLNIIEPFIPFAEETGIKLNTSVMFLKSVTMIRYLNNLPGVPSIPQEYLKKMMDAPVKKDAGMEVAAGFIKEVAPLCDGVVLLAIGWRDRLSQFLDLIGR
ncbi:methylenetetrahydrofolate reductase [Desulforhopalus singaporensis]|uniref:Methylenetetrahydrofolate reductase n=1 Tax=Desulforhopalus singaporensis TaxID=91360 RepID=A0A1H0LFY2_9BACT|nr:methylenetetrahydrofolate reductase [Desulforhopalus singaporensis]SDO67128.1 5,10-methylenetetrahydrofolate reductase [Desulforhopalus singaporensis]